MPVDLCLYPDYKPVEINTISWVSFTYVCIQEENTVIFRREILRKHEVVDSVASLTMGRQSWLCTVVQGRKDDCAGTVRSGLSNPCGKDRWSVMFRKFCQNRKTSFVGSI